MRHSRSRRAALFVALLTESVLLGSCGQKSATNHQSFMAEITADREVLTIELRELPEVKPVSATLTNRDVGSARARIGGTLVELSVREGDVVSEGQVIAVISDDRRNLEANAASSSAAAAEARAIEARAALKRVEELFAQGVYAQARLDSARAEARSAEAQLKAARSGSAAFAEVASQGKVLAPAAGKVTRAPTPQGAVVMPGEVIAEIATGRRILRVELPEADAGGFVEGDEIEIATADGAGQNRTKIVQIYPAVRDGKIIVDIDASGFDDAFVGMRVPVLMPVGMRSIVAAPERFLSVRYGVDYVRLQSDGGDFDIPVQRGRAFSAGGEALIEILAGLRVGDVIVAPERAKPDRQVAATEERP